MRGLLDVSGDDEALAEVIHRLYRHLVAHDFDALLASEAAWDAYVGAIESCFGPLADDHGYDVPVALSDLTEGMHYVRAWLSPLAQELPRIDVAHAAMAGMCTMVAIAAQRDQGAGFMLTEHGIFLREAYLASAGDQGSLFLKLLRLGFARRMTELSYTFADQVSPCCDANQRWELRLGAHPERVSTIYYGVDSSVFRAVPREPNAAPLVVWVGRIDPLKDVETLLQSAALVHEARPDVQFRLHGAAAPGGELYNERCLQLRHDLGLDDVVAFPGFTSTPQTAFQAADLVVLSSISEGFPYSILEAMLCSRPIVATAVGGIAEQVGPCGLVVEPRNPGQMADAIVTLLADPQRLADLGELARQRAEELFSLSNEREAHMRAYDRLNRATIELVDESVLVSGTPTAAVSAASAAPVGSSPVDHLTDDIDVLDVLDLLSVEDLQRLTAPTSLATADVASAEAGGMATEPGGAGVGGGVPGARHLVAPGPGRRGGQLVAGQRRGRPRRHGRGRRRRPRRARRPRDRGRRRRRHRRRRRRRRRPGR